MSHHCKWHTKVSSSPDLLMGAIISLSHVILGRLLNLWLKQTTPLSKVLFAAGIWKVHAIHLQTHYKVIKIQFERLLNKNAFLTCISYCCFLEECCHHGQIHSCRNLGTQHRNNCFKSCTKPLSPKGLIEHIYVMVNFSLVLAIVRLQSTDGNKKWINAVHHIHYSNNIWEH